ncbi:hypothetical protein D9M73_119510 [compost metagenome]
MLDTFAGERRIRRMVAGGDVAARARTGVAGHPAWGLRQMEADRQRRAIRNRKRDRIRHIVGTSWDRHLCAPAERQRVIASGTDTRRPARLGQGEMHRVDRERGRADKVGEVDPQPRAAARQAHRLTQRRIAQFGGDPGIRLVRLLLRRCPTRMPLRCAGVAGCGARQRRGGKRQHRGQRTKDHRQVSRLDGGTARHAICSGATGA